MTRTVLITGTSTGFGEATARLFASRGWNVVATMRRPEEGAALAGLDNVLVTRLDVQDQASIDAALAAGIERFGRLDVLVNNAGFGLFGVFEGTSRDKIREQFDVNLFGLMDVTRAVLPHFRAHRAGVIVNVSSGAGVFALPMISLYCASKFALEGFSASLSYELASLGIAVKVVEPGGVTSTRFGERSGGEAARAAVPADYEPFVTAAQEVFAGLRAARADATSDEVAEVIWTAATDGSDRLRYVATDDIKPLVAARRETSEDAYLAFMRERVGPKTGQERPGRGEAA
ncbi:SDR family oxidoreductase [Microvirga terrae]|uniref:SDR family oxidoreductase n=1 Tax=Microvirga terrae TaxID=2740529 RepID=A0ABY5RRC3_9HYPH|nr:SDR family oxidoreductase [Microvirga terrae]UVF19803.1 SDR family oxidoreductase [Microvirga terrae]